MQKDFQEPAFRAKALDAAKRGLQYLKENYSYSKQIPGLENLVKALS